MTLHAEPRKIKLARVKAQHSAQNRAKWRGMVVLCPTGTKNVRKNYY